MTTIEIKATSLLMQAGIVCEHVVVGSLGMLIRPTPETLDAARKFMDSCPMLKNVKSVWNPTTERTVIRADWR